MRAVDHRHARALVPEHAHDGVQLGAALGELRAQRVAETVGGDGRVPTRVHQPGRLARPAQRDVDQVVRGEQLAVPHEQVAHRHAGEVVHEGPLAPAGPKGDDGPDRRRGVLVQRHDALAVGLAGRDAQARSAIGVAVQAVEGEALDLAAPGAGPARGQQRRPLKRALQPCDRVHHPRELGGRDEARHAMRRTWVVAAVEQRAARNTHPAHGGGFAEKHAQRRGPRPARDRRQRLSRARDWARAPWRRGSPARGRG